MTSNAQKAQAIFLSAIEEHKPEGWPAFVATACADNGELQAQVERLLHGTRQTGHISREGSRQHHRPHPRPLTDRGTPRHLDRSLQAACSRSAKGAWASSTWPSRPSRSSGAVALKIIKPGMDTQQVIARFEAERQALALMDHPNIARVLDAGTTDSGPALLRDGAGRRASRSPSTATSSN